MAGTIWHSRLKEAALAFAATPSAEAADSRLRNAAVEFAAATARPRARRMHEAGAASLGDRLGLRFSREQLLAVADWFNDRTDDVE